MASLTQLNYVVAVDQCRHFGRAAKMCHVSQPTLSTQLAKLEDELGVILFDRNKQPILPTKEGLIFIEQAHVIINEHRRLEQLAKRTTQDLSGELRIAVIPTVAPYITSILLEKFADVHKEIELSIEELSTEKIIEALDRDLIDAAILATPLELTRIDEEVLYYEPFVLYASEGHPLTKLSRVNESSLNSNEIWLLTEEHCLRDQIITLCRDKKKTPGFHNVHLKSHNLETLIELVARGHGYTLLPQMAADLVRKRKLNGQLIEFAKPVPAREISLIHRRGHLKQNSLQALRDTLREQVPKPFERVRNKSMRVIGASVI